MGVNYGDFRPRGESFKNINPIILGSIGTHDVNFEKFVIEEEVAITVNAELDKVQAAYNKRFNFPPPKC